MEFHWKTIANIKISISKRLSMCESSVKKIDDELRPISKPSECKTANLISCPICDEKCSNIFIHLKQKIKNKGHKICLKKAGKYNARSITKPLSSYPAGFKRRKNSNSYYPNYVFSCSRCRIRFDGSEIKYKFGIWSEETMFSECPICGSESSSCERGQGKVEYKPSNAQLEAWKHNLEIAREVRSEEAEKSKIIPIKHVPPIMQKVHSQKN